MMARDQVISVVRHDLHEVDLYLEGTTVAVDFIEDYLRDVVRPLLTAAGEYAFPRARIVAQADEWRFALDDNPRLTASYEQAELRLAEVEIRTLMMIDSLDMDEDDRQVILSQCRKCDNTRLVITHGNGPQVGLLALQAAALGEVDPDRPSDAARAHAEVAVEALVLVGELPHPASGQLEETGLLGPLSEGGEQDGFGQVDEALIGIGAEVTEDRLALITHPPGQVRGRGPVQGTAAVVVAGLAMNLTGLDDAPSEVRDAYADAFRIGTSIGGGVISGRDPASLAIVEAQAPSVVGAVEGPTDIDGDALLQGYLRLFRGRGGGLVTGQRVTAIRRESEAWRVHAGGDEAIRTKCLDPGRKAVRLADADAARDDTAGAMVEPQPDIGFDANAAAGLNRLRSALQQPEQGSRVGFRPVPGRGEVHYVEPFSALPGVVGIAVQVLGPVIAGRVSGAGIRPGFAGVDLHPGRVLCAGDAEETLAAVSICKFKGDWPLMNADAR